MTKPLNVEKLRRDAHLRKKAKGIQHTKALDEIAQEHGYEKWTDLIAAQNGLERSEQRRTRTPYNMMRAGSRQSLEDQPPEGAHLSPYENPSLVKQIFRS